MEMTDDGIKITLRMGTEELQALEDFMGERDLENKSVMPSEGGIFVRLSDIHLDALNQLVQRGMCLNEEEFIRRCVLDKIVPKTVEEEAIEDSFRTAQRNAALK